jgi:hypothetical protein
MAKRLGRAQRLQLGACTPQQLACVEAAFAAMQPCDSVSWLSVRVWDDVYVERLSGKSSARMLAACARVMPQLRCLSFADRNGLPGVPAFRQLRHLHLAAEFPDASRACLRSLQHLRQLETLAMHADPPYQVSGMGMEVDLRPLVHLRLLAWGMDFDPEQLLLPPACEVYLCDVCYCYSAMWQGLNVRHLDMHDSDDVSQCSASGTSALSLPRFAASQGLLTLRVLMAGRQDGSARAMPRSVTVPMSLDLPLLSGLTRLAIANYSNREVVRIPSRMRALRILHVTAFKLDVSLDDAEQLAASLEELGFWFEAIECDELGLLDASLGAQGAWLMQQRMRRCSLRLPWRYDRPVHCIYMGGTGRTWPQWAECWCGTCLKCWQHSGSRFKPFYNTECDYNSESSSDASSESSSESSSDDEESSSDSE